MPADILLTVVATSVVQSVFGVGVLLFGTPLLLLLGYHGQNQSQHGDRRIAGFGSVEKLFKGY